MKKECIRNIKLLKKLQKAGLINFCSQTGTKIRGLYSPKTFTCCYIDGAVNSSIFEFQDNKYSVEFVDGCFFPYVFKFVK